MTTLGELKIKCDLCGGPNGDIWCHCDGGIGTPIRYGANLHFCNECNENRKEETEAIRRKTMDKNRAECVESLRRNIWDRDMDSGMVYYTFQYWFQNEHETLEEYETWLGFSLPDYFKEWILNLKCDQCGTEIHKYGKDESNDICEALGLEWPGERPEAFTKEEKENPLWFDEEGKPTKAEIVEWTRRYKEYHSEELREWDGKVAKIRRALKPLWTARKHLIPSPEFPENLKHVTFDKLKDYTEYQEYNKLYKKHRKSELHIHCCSEECVAKAQSEDKDLVQILY